MTKRLNVISTRVLRSGTSNTGKAWTLYEVTATDEHGQPIQEQLKAFTNFPAGPIEVEVEKQVHEKYGTSYLLKAPGGGGGGGGGGAGQGGLGKSVDDLRLRVENLEQRVQHLADQLGANSVSAGPTPGTHTGVGGSGPLPSQGYGNPPAQPAKTASFGGDDDIPF